MSLDERSKYRRLLVENRSSAVTAKQTDDSPVDAQVSVAR
jgi:hypothetical protein